jgi:hypothetical protein
MQENWRMPSLEQQIPGLLAVVAIMTTVLGLLWLIGPSA